jgi:hypothetical protein
MKNKQNLFSIKTIQPFWKEEKKLFGILGNKQK